jgi:hypothetical protein
MAIKKQVTAADTASNRWFNFEDNRHVVLQPVGPNYFVDAHSVKTRQGFFMAIPCSLDERGECKLCESYDLRQVLLWEAVDHGEVGGVVKRLKLSKTAARQLLSLLEGKEPSKCIIEMWRWTPDESRPNNVKWCIDLERDDADPMEPDPGTDMYADLLALMNPKVQNRFVPNYQRLKQTVREREDDPEGRWEI